jgi:hypothetical protein
MKSTMNLAVRLLMLVAAMSVTGALRAQDRQVIDETRLVSANERITLDVMRGQATIRAGNDNTFSVKGLLDEQAEGFELESNNGFTRFIVRMPRSSRGWNSRRGDGSELEITVPANSEVEFSGVNIGVDIAGVLGGARITTVNGEISARGLGEQVHLKTVNGAISSENNRGRINIETVNGEVSDRGSEGRLSAEAVNGELRIDSRAEEVRLGVVNGQIEAELSGTQSLEFNGVNGEITISLRDSMAPRVRGGSVSGRIELSVDRDIDARFNLQTNVGSRLENELTSDEARRPQFGPGRSLQFSTGQGSGAVDISTVSGAINLEVN